MTTLHKPTVFPVPFVRVLLICRPEKLMQTIKAAIDTGWERIEVLDVETADGRCLVHLIATPLS